MRDCYHSKVKIYLCTMANQTGVLCYRLQYLGTFIGNIKLQVPVVINDVDTNSHTPQRRDQHLPNSRLVVVAALGVMVTIVGGSRDKHRDVITMRRG